MGSCRGLRGAARGRGPVHLRAKVRAFRSAWWAVARWGEAQDILGSLLVLDGSAPGWPQEGMWGWWVVIMAWPGRSGRVWQREPGPAPSPAWAGWEGAEPCAAGRQKVGNGPGSTGEEPGPPPAGKRRVRSSKGTRLDPPSPSFPCGLAGKAWARPAPWSWQGSKGGKPSSALAH